MKTKIFIDFDGVILDTWSVISNEYIKKYRSNEFIDKKVREIMLEIGWDKIIESSKIINDAIKKIQKLSSEFDVTIITKVNSNEEKYFKKIFLNKHGLKNIIFVPYSKNKSEYVSAYNNFLVDDDIMNLKDWTKNGGISIFFNQHLSHVDSYGIFNNNYYEIDDFDKIYDIIPLGGNYGN